MGLDSLYNVRVIMVDEDGRTVALPSPNNLLFSKRRSSLTATSPALQASTQSSHTVTRVFQSCPLEDLVDESILGRMCQQVVQGYNVGVISLGIGYQKEHF